MAATTVNLAVKRQGRDGGIVSAPVAASTNILEGTLVFLDASGNAVGVKASQTTIFAGLSRQQFDNSAGAAGDVHAEMWSDGAVELLFDGAVAQTNVGATAYGVDNQTASLTASGNPAIGLITRVSPRTGNYAFVELHGLGRGTPTPGTA